MKSYAHSLSMLLLVSQAALAADWIQVPAGGFSKDFEIARGTHSSAAGSGLRVARKDNGDFSHWLLIGPDAQAPGAETVVDARLLDESNRSSYPFLGAFLPGQDRILMSDFRGWGYDYEYDPGSVLVGSTGETLARFQGYPGLRASRAITKDGSRAILLRNSRHSPNRAVIQSLSTPDATPITLEGESRYAQHLGAITSDGRYAATIDRVEGNVVIRDGVSGKKIEEALFSFGTPTDLLFSNDARATAIAVVASGYGPGGAVYGAGLKRVRGANAAFKSLHGVSAADFHPRQDWIALAIANGEVIVAKVSALLMSESLEQAPAGAIVARHPAPKAGVPATTLRYSLDGATLTVELKDGSQHTIRVSQ